MLYIITNDGGTRAWHVSEPLPEIKIQNVVEVQADCDELEFIYREFVNIPRGRGCSATWYGDHAKFIVGNL